MNLESLEIRFGIIKTRIINNLIYLSDKLTTLFYLFGFVFVIILTMIVSAFVIVQIRIGQQQPTQLRPLVDFIFTTFSINVSNLSRIEYNQLLILGSSTVALLVTIWFAGTTTFSYYKNKKDQKKMEIIRAKPVYKVGFDDLNIMLDYYRRAEKVTVYAGDFHWLEINQSLRKEIERLAKKDRINLYSECDENTVKLAIIDKSLFDLLASKFKFNTNTKDIRCSIIEIQGVRVFLYKQKFFDGLDKVCIVQSVNEGQYLVKMIDDLLKTVSKPNK